MFCEKCGAQCSGDSNFCVACGAKITATGPGILMQTAASSASAVSGLHKHASRKSLGVVLAAAVCLMLGAYFYLGYCISSPVGVVKTMIEAYNQLDINTVIECMDPVSEKELKGVMGLTSSVSNMLFGLDIDFEDVMSVMPLLEGTEYDTFDKIGIKAVKVANVSNADLPEWMGPLLAVPAMGNLLGADAVVELTVTPEQADYLTGAGGAYSKDQTIQLEVHRYGKNGWRIAKDSDFVLVQ